MSRGSRITLRLAIAAASLLAATLALEAGVRVVSALDRNVLDEALRDSREPVGRDLTLLDLIRAHRDDRVVYELRPGVSGDFVGVEVSINSLGMRDVERSLEKPPGTVRIVALGDSHTFGWGVARDEAYPAVLEDLLREHFPGRRFEVWNLGVPGYNTVQEVRALELRLDEIDPDAIVINYVANDMDLPNFLAARPNPWTLSRLYLADLVSRRLALLRDEAPLPLDLVGVEPEERSRRYRMDRERIPERYQALYGWDNMEAAFLHLRQLAAARGIPALLLFNPDDYTGILAGERTDARPRPERELGERLRRAGYRIVDPQRRIVRYLRARALPTSSLWIRKTDSHTNPVRHRLLAEALLVELGRSGVLGTVASLEEELS